MTTMPYRMLVVDDTKFMRKMLTDILVQAGHEVVGEADNGRQAVALFRELKPDVIIMDITMPEMDGIEAIREIRMIDPHAVVLVCSAMSQQEQISDAMKAGANGYLMKPFKPDRVNEVIRTTAIPALEKRRQAEMKKFDNVIELPRPASAAAADSSSAEASVGVAGADGTNDDPGGVGDERNPAAYAGVLDESLTAVAESDVELDETIERREQEELELPALPELEGFGEPAVAAEPETAPEPLATLSTQTESKTESSEQIPATENKIINLFRRNEKLKQFTSSYMCQWQEEWKGNTVHYRAICTESENELIIQMSIGDSQQTISLPIDTFRQLNTWLEKSLALSQSLSISSSRESLGRKIDS